MGINQMKTKPINLMYGRQIVDQGMFSSVIIVPGKTTIKDKILYILGKIILFSMISLLMAIMVTFLYFNPKYLPIFCGTFITSFGITMMSLIFARR